MTHKTLLISTIKAAKLQLSEWQSLGKKIALVPTMGALHTAHTSLINKAFQYADKVVVSLFVNPRQFTVGEDLETYPKTLAKDFKLLTELGVDMVFTPDGDEMYPPNFQTSIVNMSIAQGLCATARPHFFSGVCTVVLKLFNIIRPDLAVFGKKDYQQLLVIKQLVKDLNLNIKILAGEIVRLESGLAFSSRNRYLSKSELVQASYFPQALQFSQKLFESGVNSSCEILGVIKQNLLDKQIRVEYLNIRTIKDFVEIKETIQEPAIVLAAVRIGKTRLIDNYELHVV